MDEIGIRELRQNASAHVRAASAGAHLVVTDRGVPVAQLVPLSPLEEQLSALLVRHTLSTPSRPRRSYAADRRLRGAPLAPRVTAGREERFE